MSGYGAPASVTFGAAFGIIHPPNGTIPPLPRQNAPRMTTRLTLLSLTACVSLCTLGAQDIHFSQFYMSPTNLNPALTGVMNATIRVSGNYRNQYASIVRSGVYSTYSASYDQRFTSGRYDYWGLGATAWGDRAGTANFGTTTFKASGSYAKRLGGNRSRSHYLSFGATVGLAQRSIEFGQLRWGNQWNGTEFDESIDPKERGNFNNPNFNFVNAEVGVLWFSNFGDGANVYAGGAFHNINRPNQSFQTGGTDLAFSRFTIHAGGEVPLSADVALVPGVITMIQGPSLQVNSGANLKFKFGKSRFNSQAFHAGLWTRVANNDNGGVLNDAVIIQTRFDYNEYAIGFSYDINTSSLNEGTNGQGGFEIALQYRWKGDEDRGVYCPDF